jgi:hypothetical protein
MKTRIYKFLALFFVATTSITCGDADEAIEAISSANRHQVAKDIDLFKFECDIAEDGTTVLSARQTKLSVCQYDEYLDDWGWIPQN